MKILVQIKAVLVGSVLLVFFLLPACIIALPFGLGRRLKIMSPVWKRFGKLSLRYACQAKIDISEDRRSPEYQGIPPEGALYVANHQSYIDIPLVMTIYQVPPIMKKEVLYIPIFGWIAYASGSLPVSRSQLSSRKKVFARAKERILTEKIALQVYPEGTRSKNAIPKSIEEVKKTLLIFAYSEKIPVIPTSIYGTRGVLSSKGFVKPNRHLGIIVHNAIDPKNFESMEEFCHACWGKVIEGHDQMKAQLAPLN